MNGFGMGVDQSHIHRLKEGCKEAILHYLFCCLVVLLVVGGPERELGWLIYWYNGEEHLEDSQQLFFIKSDKAFSLF